MSVNVKQNGNLTKVANNISIAQANWNDRGNTSKNTCIKNQPATLKTLEEIAANTDANALAGANAVKQLNDSLGGYKLTTKDGKIAYYKESEGADSAVPFKSVENIDIPTITTKANTYFFYNAGHRFVDYTLKYDADHSSVTIYANNEPSLTNATRIAGTSYDLVSQTISNTFEIKNYKFIIVVGAQYGYDHSSYATLSFKN